MIAMEQNKNDMRWRHYMWAIFGGLILTIVAVVVYASMQESYQRKMVGRWRWADWLALVGWGMVGQAMQLFVIWLNLNY